MLTDKLLEIMGTDFWPTDSDAEAFARMFAAATAKVGVPIILIDEDDTAYPYGWNGEVLRIETGERTAYDLAHELAHYLACSPERRKLVEFGLGPGFATSGYIEPVVNEDIQQAEEDQACILAALILHEFGRPNLTESQMVQFVNKSDDGRVGWYTMWGIETRLPAMLDLMIARGLITDDLKVTYTPRQEPDAPDVLL